MNKLEQSERFLSEAQVENEDSKALKTTILNQEQSKLAEKEREYPNLKNEKARKQESIVIAQKLCHCIIDTS